MCIEDSLTPKIVKTIADARVLSLLSWILSSMNTLTPMQLNDWPHTGEHRRRCCGSSALYRGSCGVDPCEISEPTSCQIEITTNDHSLVRGSRPTSCTAVRTPSRTGRIPSGQFALRIGRLFHSTSSLKKMTLTEPPDHPSRHSFLVSRDAGNSYRLQSSIPRPGRSESTYTASMTGS